jgi:hypothetical protein
MRHYHMRMGETCELFPLDVCRCSSLIRTFDAIDLSKQPSQEDGAPGHKQCSTAKQGCSLCGRQNPEKRIRVADSVRIMQINHILVRVLTSRCESSNARPSPNK